MQRKGRSLTGPFLRGAQGGAELRLLHRALLHRAFAPVPASQNPPPCIPKPAALHPKKKPRGHGAARLFHNPGWRSYLILPSLYSTCLRTTGSYLRTVIFSVMVRAFFLVT